MAKQRFTRSAVQAAQRAKVGRRDDVQSTDADRARLAEVADAQAARLARIAERSKKS